MTSPTHPKMIPIRQHFVDDAVPDLEAHITQKIRSLDLKLAPYARIALAVGSRGVSPLKQVVSTILAELRALGAEPFVVPAMGSHGGGTAEGQREVLANYGISESGIGVEVRSSMDTVVLGTTEAGVPVHMDANAAGADGIVVIGRVKPHTGFRGPVESGLCKMLAVGLGKAAGARNIHAGGLAIAIPAAAKIATTKAPILFGVALVENAFDRPCRVEVAPPTRFYETDNTLLDVAWTKMPRIPVDAADLLIVDEMGKNVSGTGMDPNIVGMWRRFGGDRTPNYARLAVLGLTDASHGNATGLGLADFTTRRLVDAINWPETRLNALTALDPLICRTPMTLDDDRQCVDTALDLLQRATGRAPSAIRIKNTLELEHLWVSEDLAADLPNTAEPTGDPQPLSFDPTNRLV
jgi:hypothetical protein